jgi:phosphohistidine swiveling domain-containing protein
MSPARPQLAVTAVSFGSKAQTLEKLSGRPKHATVLPCLIFSAGEWQKSSAAILARLRKLEWAAGPLAVRSSAIDEDNHAQSKAGHYLSLLNISGEAAISEAIEQVIASYDDDARHEVLLQPMVEAIAASGVAFTMDPSSGGHYRVINYDDSSGRTDSVTAGDTNAVKVFYAHRESRIHPSGFLGKLLALCDELEALLHCQALDIEFAATRGGELVLLQVRPLVMAAPAQSAAEHAQAIGRIVHKMQAGMCAHPYLYGSRTVYGVMPDWNPAEIIGLKPKPLALSLYRDMVTDAIWAYQRDNYGYHNLRGFPLLHDFEGLPYTDVRVSFNSFIPKSLPAAVAGKLLNHYIDRLIARPLLHDKVEFSIVFSCYTLDLRQRLKVLHANGFTEAECEAIATSLTELTNRIVAPENGLWRQDIHKIEMLEKRQQTLAAQPLDAVSNLYWLLEDCRRYGTLPFAGLARAGFIAVQLLQSMVAVGIIDRQDHATFMASVDSVSSRMGRDFHDMGKEAFLEQYGHLRPGTYDILSPRYDEAPERYFDWSKRDKAASNQKHAAFALSIPKLRTLQDHLNADGVHLDALQLLEFIKTAIEAREYAKFVFTRSVSDFLKQLEMLGRQAGFSRADMAYVNVRDVLSLYSSSDAPAQVFGHSIAYGKRHFELTRSLVLPPVMVEPSDVWAFHLPASQPNYVTQLAVEAPVICLNPDRNAPPLAGAIVCIPSADPGYDWLFSHAIAGLVTAYGGVNSHMAIRAGELKIPAVIGCGEVLYGQWSQAHRLSIDCLNQQVRVLQ